MEIMRVFSIITEFKNSVLVPFEVFSSVSLLIRTMDVTSVTAHNAFNSPYRDGKGSCARHTFCGWSTSPPWGVTVLASIYKFRNNFLRFCFWTTSLVMNSFFEIGRKAFGNKENLWIRSIHLSRVINVKENVV